MTEMDLSKRYMYWFCEIAAIPHGSGNERELSDRIVRFAKENGLKWKQDEIGNVIVEKPASDGCGNAQPVILQAHIDMVNEKTMGSPHDFDHDPLQLFTEDGWLYARDTTLGADDGKGAAYMLAILEDRTLVHPPLQCIFTVMEEVGLDGAKELKKEDIHASRMISLDGGGEHVTETSSSAACRQKVTRITETSPCRDAAVYALTIRGLRGGHSAGVIHLGRGNAILLAARMLHEADRRGAGIRICSWEGGSKNNAIPSYAEVVFCCSDDEMMKRSMAESERNIRDEYHVTEPDMEILLKSSEAAVSFSRADTESLLRFLMIVPDGFMKQNPEIPGLTSLSSNTGVIHTMSDRIELDLLSRADRDSALDHLIARIAAAAEVCGLSHECGDRDPAWFYTPESEMREIYAEVLRKHDMELVCEATHGGLECGVFKGLNPEMDIITFGAVSEKEHAVGERLNLASFERAYGILLDILSALTIR